MQPRDEWWLKELRYQLDARLVDKLTDDQCQLVTREFDAAARAIAEDEAARELSINPAMLDLPLEPYL